MLILQVDQFFLQPFSLYLDSTSINRSLRLWLFFFKRFPIPDLRPLHDTSRSPWWQRNVRPDAIVFDLSDGAFSTTFESGSPKMELDVTAKDIHASYLENASHPEEMISFLRGSCISDAEDAGIPR